MKRTDPIVGDNAFFFYDTGSIANGEIPEVKDTASKEEKLV